MIRARFRSKNCPNVRFGLTALAGFAMAVSACLPDAHSQNLTPPAPPAAKSASTSVATTKQFETHIRPMLLASCVSCHGKDSPGGGLRLDVAITPDKAKELIRRVKGEGGKPRMPLGSTLSKDKIADLEEWVRTGAVWPESAPVAPQVDLQARIRAHWSFKPISHPIVPPASSFKSQSAWVRNPIDAFILKGLVSKGLKPNPSATRRELIRRLSFDLTGLPPTPEEITAFEQDRTPDAYGALVDRLLASPHYGEKWGRHWLDLVRYAETNSYERDNPKPNAYKYRDYVIRAFNTDKPYDRFVREQIAGDEMPREAGDALAATGYYRLGIWDDEPADLKQAEYDDLDDLVTTTGQAFLGLTLDCARCHDHKFDPVPQTDYYRMAAFFRNVNRFKNGGPTDEAAYFADAQEKQQYGAKLAALEVKRKDSAELLRTVEADYSKKRDNLIHPDDIADLHYRYFEGTFNSMPNFEQMMPLKSGTVSPCIIDLKARRREENFGYVFEGMLNAPRAGDYSFYLDTDDGSLLTVNGKKLLQKAGGGQGAEMRATLKLKAGLNPFRIDYFQSTGPFGLNFAWSGPGFIRRPLSALSACSSLGMQTLVNAELAQVVGKDAADRYIKLNTEKAELDKQNVPALMVLCVTESGSKAADMFVLKRGNPNTPDQKVEPGFPVCAGGGDAVITAAPVDGKTTGRRTQLANWLASPTNPLTPRVIVNRIWLGHFGRGIVRTPNDFGLQGARPTHPELLDWLASEFINEGWSFKKIHKLIVTSNAYKQSSQANAAGLKADPTNDSFWRFDMRRLEAEEIRDSILAVSGNLNLKLYGEPIYPEIPKDILAAQSIPGYGWHTDQTKPEDMSRRSIYIHVKRSLIYPLLATFDLPDTDRTTAMRFASTQPTQALGLVNGPFINHQSQVMAERISKEIGPTGDDHAFVHRAFALTMQREPTEGEIKVGVTLLMQLRDRGAKPEQALQYLCLTAMNLNEFVYLD